MPESETLCSRSVLAEEPAQAWVKLQAEDTRGRKPEQVPFESLVCASATGCHAISTMTYMSTLLLCSTQAGVPSLGLREGKPLYD